MEVRREGDDEEAAEETGEGLRVLASLLVLLLEASLDSSRLNLLPLPLPFPLPPDDDEATLSRDGLLVIPAMVEHPVCVLRVVYDLMQTCQSSELAIQNTRSD